MIVNHIIVRYMTFTGLDRYSEFNIDPVDIKGYRAFLIDPNTTRGKARIEVDQVDGTQKTFDTTVTGITEIIETRADLRMTDGIYIVSQPKDVTVPPRAYMSVVVNRPVDVIYNWQQSNQMSGTWTDSTISSATTDTLAIPEGTTYQYRRCIITTPSGEEIITRIAHVTHIESEAQISDD